MPTVSTRTPRRPSASRRLSGECASVTRQQRLSVPPAGLARWTREGVQLPALPAVYGELPGTSRPGFSTMRCDSEAFDSSASRLFLREAVCQRSTCHARPSGGYYRGVPYSNNNWHRDISILCGSNSFRPLKTRTRVCIIVLNEVIYPISNQSKTPQNRFFTLTQ